MTVKHKTVYANLQWTRQFSNQEVYHFVRYCIQKHVFGPAYHIAANLPVSSWRMIQIILMGNDHLSTMNEIQCLMPFCEYHFKERFWYSITLTVLSEEGVRITREQDGRPRGGTGRCVLSHGHGEEPQWTLQEIDQESSAARPQVLLSEKY